MDPASERTPRATSRPGVLLALGSVAVAVLLAGAAELIERDRTALFDQWRVERASQLEQAVRGVEDDLGDVVDDLAFLADLVERTPAPTERSRAAAALVGVVTPYMAVAFGDAEGVVDLVFDEQHADGLSPGLRDRLEVTLARADRLEIGRVETSPPLLVDASEAWVRVFATPLASTPGQPTVVALVVDTEPFLRPLGMAGSEGSSRLLVLGPHGRPAPITSPALRALWDPESSALPPLDPLLERMRRGEAGSGRIDGAQAAKLGLPSADAIVVFAPIQVEGGGAWSAASIVSMAALQSHEQAIVLRVGGAAALGGLLWILFGGYAYGAARRTDRLREQLQEADRLAVLREKAEKILEAIPTAVLVLGADGRTTAINAAMRLRIPDFVIGGGLDEAFPDASASSHTRLRELVDRAVVVHRTTSLAAAELDLFGVEGRYSVHAVPLQPGAEDAQVLVVVDDLTEVATLQDQLLRAEKLATVGVLAAGIAHEIGTPLGVIRGRAEYATGKLGADHPVSAGLGVIVEQTDTVSRVIRALLDFSRPQPARVAAVPMGPLLARVAELLELEAKRRQVRIVVGPVADATVSADADQLQQVLVNLVVNALDACERGGTVTLGAELGEDGVQIEVTDDGAGIAPEDLRRVFDPFFTTKKRGQGTGLGLAIVDRIVRGHGGSIELVSAPGSGTRARLTWPAGAGAEARVG